VLPVSEYVDLRPDITCTVVEVESEGRVAVG
jgi:hypothetical protein